MREYTLRLSDYDKYVLESELAIRIFQIKATRDKAGISPDDKESEPNKHIESILTVCKQLEIDLDYVL